MDRVCFCLLGVVWGGSDYQGAERNGEGVAKGALEGAVDILVTQGEVADGVAVVGPELQGEGCAVVIGHAVDSSGDGEVVAIEGTVAHQSADGVVHVEVESLHDLEDHGGRLDGDELVVHIGVGIEQAQVSEGVEVAADGGLALGVVLDEDARTAGIDRWGDEQVEHCDAYGDEQGEGEPLPVGKAESEEVFQRHEVIGSLLFGSSHNCQL